jgi:hypothetical protein
MQAGLVVVELESYHTMRGGHALRKGWPDFKSVAYIDMSRDLANVTHQPENGFMAGANFERRGLASEQ